MKIQINSDKIIGTIKPMHGVGQPPFTNPRFKMFHYLTEAGIPYSRLHDVGGAYGNMRYVDVPNIFRDFDADPSDPASYDFTFTDLLITALIKSGVEPFYRLGVTIEVDSSIKAYRIFPPSDYKKWAVICEHIIRHYTEGWADGFNYDMKYWEIWNEPDNDEEILDNHLWRGTKEEFYEFYGVASKHLKSCFPHLKIGGYGSCGFYFITDSFVESANSSRRLGYFKVFLDGFIDYVKENGCPFDFFSWHSYDNIENTLVYAHYARERLDEAGFTDTETICNEWNCFAKYRGTARHAALVAGVMLGFQNTPLDSAMFYDARFGISIYGSLFNPLTAKPFPAYYAFTSYNELYKLKNQIEVTLDKKLLYAVGAKCENRVAVVISNPTDEDEEIFLDTQGKLTKCIITTEGKTNEQTPIPSVLPKESVLLIHIEI